MCLSHRNVPRITVTDSNIVNYVQCSRTKLSSGSQQLGKTVLMLCFGGESTCSHHKVTVIRDQNVEEQRLIDFGRPERKLAVISPNSNVYLTPTGVQIYVRGQATKAKAATGSLQDCANRSHLSIWPYSDLHAQDSCGGNGPVEARKNTVCCQQSAFTAATKKYLILPRSHCSCPFAKNQNY